MTHITIDERVSARDLEPLIDGQWADQAADIFRFDRTYAEAAEWLARFNQQKDLIAFHPNTKIWGVDWEGKVGAAVDVPLVMDLNSTLKNLRASVAHADQKLSDGLESLKAYMKQTIPAAEQLAQARKSNNLPFRSLFWQLLRNQGKSMKVRSCTVQFSFYHIIVCGNRRQKIFRDDQDWLLSGASRMLLPALRSLATIPTRTVCGAVFAERICDNEL
jgi:hypothetical protein